MFPTFSTPSRNLCITVFETAAAVDIRLPLCLSSLQQPAISGAPLQAMMR
jgi:hypothetical protein